MKCIMIVFLVIIPVLQTAAQQKITGLEGWNIFLDPGHSQDENMGVYNYSEAKKVLRVAMELRNLLLTTTDIDTVYLSRTNDNQSVSLSQRTDFANSLGTAWYHSIHSDAGSASANSTLLLWGMYANGQEKNPPGGQAMSTFMIDNLTRGYRTYTTSGSIGDCKFYGGCSGNGPYLHVNRESTMPSELSESGFHTNPRQNQLNMNADWKKLEAYTFYWSILAYHTIPRPPVHILTGIIFNQESRLAINGAEIIYDTFYYKTDTYESLFNQYSRDPEQLRNGFYYFDGVLQSSLELKIQAPYFEPKTVSVTMIDTFFTFADIGLISILPPHVDAVSPQANQSAVIINSPIEVTFSRPIDHQLLEQQWKIEPPVTGKFSWNTHYTILKFIPDSLVAETLYRITIPAAVTDLYGHGFDGNRDSLAGDDYVLEFTTGVADIYPPEIVTIYPVDKDSTYYLQPAINLVFNEDLDTLSLVDTSITFDQMPSATSVPVYRHYYSINRHGIISLFPQDKLLPLTQYRIKIWPGIADPLGNTIDRSKRTVFYTRNLDDQILMIDNFESGLTTNWWKPQSSGSTAGIVTDSTDRLADSSVYIPMDQGHIGYELAYAWDTLSAEWLIRAYLSGGDPRNIYFTAKGILQVYILGDSSFNQFRFALDEGSVHEVSPWFTIDWYGWRIVEWNLSTDSSGIWAGTGGDGVLTGQLRFDSFQFRYQPGARAIGRLYLDDLQIASRLPVVISENQIPLPERSCILSSYPNPFSLQTCLRFYLAQSGQVGFSVYNLLGEKVSDLGVSWLNKGVHQFTFKPNNFPAGVYFFTLNYNQNQSLTRKMIYVK